MYLVFLFVFLFFSSSKIKGCKEGGGGSSQQRNRAELQSDVLGPDTREDVETSQLHRGAAVGQASRPWVHDVCHQGIDHIWLPAVYVHTSCTSLQSHFFLTDHLPPIWQFHTDAGTKEEELCPGCVEHSTHDDERIGAITAGNEVWFYLPSALLF